MFPRKQLYISLKILKAHIPWLRRLRLLKITPPVSSYGERVIFNAAAGNAILRDHIASHKPIAAGKIGDTELEVLLKFERFRDDPSKFFRSIAVEGHECDLLFLNCGVFPREQGTLVGWARTYLAALSSLNLVGAWYNEGEEQITRKYAPTASLTEITALEPYYHQEPWSEALAGKHVLVVSPFKDSILHQRQSHDGVALFPHNPRAFPDFELTVVRSPFSAGLVEPAHPDWHVALDDMRTQIGRIEFDVGLIGAGAFSLPLCAFIRDRLGRPAIHLGGPMQVLFGIRGKRWDTHPIIRTFYNDNWIRPLPHERPRRRWMNDGGAYW